MVPVVPSSLFLVDVVLVDENAWGGTMIDCNVFFPSMSRPSGKVNNATGLNDDIRSLLPTNEVAGECVLTAVLLPLLALLSIFTTVCNDGLLSKIRPSGKVSGADVLGGMLFDVWVVDTDSLL